MDTILVRSRPIHAEACAPREFGMHQHDRAAIAIQKRMAVGRIAMTSPAFSAINALSRPFSSAQSMALRMSFGCAKMNWPLFTKMWDAFP
ncbi:hypothetical protein [Bradyrhizobium sp. Tv2a-2]|uniref:hypothetical protein n=1 Tax=Bradyrhizobium sp. Tv2a-2 TaxID=113395 RepID=UPI000567CDE3|nr:hypothetical protein [Bradyrhizobium sp. Tv2a-2]